MRIMVKNAFCVALVCALFLAGCAGISSIGESFQGKGVATPSDTRGADDDLRTLFSAPEPELPDSSPLITNVAGRNGESLNGTWNIVVDEHEVGTRPFLGGPYYKEPIRETGMELVEFSFDSRRTLDVPGDWNSQDDRLFRYRGVVWYQRSVSLQKEDDKRYFLHFDGVNYDAQIYVNQQPLAKHRGGYVAFNMDATDLLVDGENSIVVRVDAHRDDATIPTKKSSDFFKYGGITRDVHLITVPDTFIRQYQLYLTNHETGTVKAWVQLDNASGGESVSISIPEADVSMSAVTDSNGRAEFKFVANLELWSPSTPKLYDVMISSRRDEVTDRIGFRTIAVDGKKILLNGKPVFFRGISMHDESYLKTGVAYDESDARTQLGLIKELNGNFVRLAHYPHNEHAVRIADELGLLVWSEIPIVSLIDWTNTDTQAVANAQLKDNIHRDLNRASIVMWSIGNETMPQSQARLAFLAELGKIARKEDVSGRLIAAALIGDVTKEFEEVGKRLVAQMVSDPEIAPVIREKFEAMLSEWGVEADEVLESEIEVMLKDRLGEIVDVIGYNEYFGWYYSSFLGSQFPVDEGTVRRHMFKLMDDVRFRNIFEKPIIISEFGAGARQGYRSREGLLWSEDYQAKVYQAQTEMIAKNDYVQGMSPWILKDFRSALRNLNGIQEIYNRKGIISDSGKKKRAFFVLQDHYAERAAAESMQ